MRKTIAQLPRGVYDFGDHGLLVDRGIRRYHPFSFDFDSTPLDLTLPEEHWEDSSRQLHLDRRAERIRRLEVQYGAEQIDVIVKNVSELGAKSMSLLTYHNDLHEQARRAFVGGAYYPALVAGCALGERILNHLVLDLRESFKTSEHYKKVYGKQSFDKWPFLIAVLSDWGVLADGVNTEFRVLGELRNRSIHFNPETYKSLREDALSALHRLNGIIGKQFGYFGRQPWFIENTPGAQFVKKAYENDPFVQAYIIPRSGFVGPLYGMERNQEGAWFHLDYADYGDHEIGDEEFSRQHRERDFTKVVTREMIDKQRRGPG